MLSSKLGYVMSAEEQARAARRHCHEMIASSLA
jgi:hypothetical protein